MASFAKARDELLVAYDEGTIDDEEFAHEYNSCLSVRYNSVFISLPLFTKGHKTTTFLKCLFSRNFDAVLYILIRIFQTVSL